MQADEAAHDREAEAGAFIGAIVGGARLEEGIAEMVRSLARMPMPVSATLTMTNCRRDARLMVTLPAARREFDRVGQEVEQNLLIGPLVADDLVELFADRRERARRRSSAL